MNFDSIKWPENERDPGKIESERLAWYKCEKCGVKWDDEKRNLASRKGEWRSRGKGIGLSTYLKIYNPMKIGFHLPSWISRMICVTWSFTGTATPARAASAER